MPSYLDQREPSCGSGTQPLLCLIPLNELAPPVTYGSDAISKHIAITLRRRHVRWPLRKRLLEPFHQSEFFTRIQGVHRDVDAHGVDPLSVMIAKSIKYTGVHSYSQTNGRPHAKLRRLRPRVLFIIRRLAAGERVLIHMHSEALTTHEDSWNIPLRINGIPPRSRRKTSPAQACYPRMNPAREPRPSTRGTTVRLEACIERLQSGDLLARDDLVTLACGRMESIARRMLRRFPKVRRWDETGDVVQNATIRLYRSLGNIAPRDARGFLGLAAVHIRRELLDLARRHAGPESFAANHETNYRRQDGQDRDRVNEAADRTDSADQLARWSLLHQSAERLPEEERELFHLVWYMGVKQDEAARMLYCSVRTVKRRWDNVKRLLRDSLDGDLPG